MYAFNTHQDILQQYSTLLNSTHHRTETISLCIIIQGHIHGPEVHLKEKVTMQRTLIPNLISDAVDMQCRLGGHHCVNNWLPSISKLSFPPGTFICQKRLITHSQRQALRSLVVLVRMMFLLLC